MSSLGMGECNKSDNKLTSQATLSCHPKPAASVRLMAEMSPLTGGRKKTTNRLG